MPDLLVVDDETATRELLYDVLGRKGFTVLTANSGKQALEMLKSQRPDGILLDCAMPGLSGVETARAIRQIDDAVPIVLLRGVSDAEPAPQELKRLGITAVLQKGAGEGFLTSLEAALTRLGPGDRGKEGGGSPVPGSVLLVDDEPRILELLSTFFTRRGLRTLTAGSGEAALALLGKRPMAVLLDMTMPGMDGLMTLKHIKEAHPSLTVIMVSGIGDEVMVQEALDAGAYDYVTKPFNLEYLETVVLTKVLLGMEA